jgi:hypothetical protein
VTCTPVRRDLDHCATQELRALCQSAVLVASAEALMEVPWQLVQHPKERNSTGL